MNSSRLKLTPDLMARFRAYHEAHPAWGSLHVMLDDDNYDCAEFCLEWAAEQGDIEGIELARICTQLTKTQIGRIAKEC